VLDLRAPASDVSHLRLPHLPRTGLDLDDEPDKAAIAARARRWRFAPPTDAERHLRGAVQAAAAHLRDHPDALPGGAGRPGTTQLAVLAVEVHEVFLRRDDGGPVAWPTPGRRRCGWP
jgi:hypothetical protein